MSEILVGRPAVAMRGASDFYRAVWRWHFYAGLLVLPFMITLAVTGGLYLFKDEIDSIVYSDLKTVEATSTVRVSPSVIVDAALAAYPGQAVTFTDPASATQSAEITVATASGDKVAVYANPYSGVVLGALPDRGTVMWTIRYLHSLKYFGTYARYAIEVAAGWAVLLVATGVYLWWPRRQRGGVISIRGSASQRMFWRDLHAVTGIFVGAIIVFLAVTGMPWSGVWGAKVNEWANGSNFGYPSGVYVDVPMSSEHLNHSAQASWSLEQAQVPMSTVAGTPIGIDRAVNIVRGLGMSPGFALSLPADAAGVYTATVYPHDVSKQRVVHLDQYSGAPLIDLDFSDYGFGAKALEWGISVHMGQEFAS